MTSRRLAAQASRTNPSSFARGNVPPIFSCPGQTIILGSLPTPSSELAKQPSWPTDTDR